MAVRTKVPSHTIRDGFSVRWSHVLYVPWGCGDDGISVWAGALIIILIRKVAFDWFLYVLIGGSLFLRFDDKWWRILLRTCTIPDVGRTCSTRSMVRIMALSADTFSDNIPTDYTHYLFWFLRFFFLSLCV